MAGEAGVGKTTLVRRFVEERDAGLRVLWAGCDDLTVPEPLAAIRDVAEQVGGVVAAALDGGQLREIGRALREELAGVAPSVCVVEDCHWADEATLDVLSYVGRRIGGTGSVLLVTFRDDELGVDHRLRVMVGSIPPADLVRVQLERLSPPSAANAGTCAHSIALRTSPALRSLDDVDATFKATTDTTARRAAVAHNLDYRKWRTIGLPASVNRPSCARLVRRSGRCTGAARSHRRLASGPKLVDRQHWAARISMPWFVQLVEAGSKAVTTSGGRPRSTKGRAAV